MVLKGLLSISKKAGILIRLILVIFGGDFRDFFGLHFFLFENFIFDFSQSRRFPSLMGLIGSVVSINLSIKAFWMFFVLENGPNFSLQFGLSLWLGLMISLINIQCCSNSNLFPLNSNSFVFSLNGNKGAFPNSLLQWVFVRAYSDSFGLDHGLHLLYFPSFDFLPFGFSLILLGFSLPNKHYNKFL